jgi:hypothetical protein
MAAAAALLTSANLAAQTTSTQVDSVRHQISFIVGPFSVPAFDKAMVEQMSEGAMDMSHEGPTTTYRFEWPVDGYAKGFRVEVRDANGRLLPRTLLHHVIGVNLDRRQFIYPAVERLFGLGKETESVTLPGKLAVPIDRSSRLGYYVSWHNDTGKSYTGVSVRVIMDWVPATAKRELIAVLPVWIDVNNTVGGDNTFDVVPGKSSKAFDFVAPLSGRILGIGGHLHDYGVAVRLDDPETSKTLVRLTATKDAAGHMESVSRKFYVFNAIRLKGGHHYRLVAEYDSPLSHTLINGAMGNIGAVFAPDDPAKWPRIDASDAAFARDMSTLGLGRWAASRVAH